MTTRSGGEFMSQTDIFDPNILDIENSEEELVNVEEVEQETDSNKVVISKEDFAIPNLDTIVVAGRQYTFNLGDYSSIKIGPYSVTIGDASSMPQSNLLDAVDKATQLIKKLTTSDIESALTTKNDGIIDGIKRTFVTRR